jgi:hypothetical protein
VSFSGSIEPTRTIEPYSERVKDRPLLIAAIVVCLVTVFINLSLAKGGSEKPAADVTMVADAKGGVWYSMGGIVVFKNRPVGEAELASPSQD